MPDSLPYPSEAARAPLAIERARLIETVQRETAVTLRVLRAYPPDQGDLKPHPRSMSARELCWLFTMEMRISARALMGAEKLYEGAEAPTSMPEIVAQFETARDQLLGVLRGCSEEDLGGTVAFPVGPGKLADWPRTEFLWLMIRDQVHHRGQLSVYLRMAGGKVPSIYGPSADEPWS